MALSSRELLLVLRARDEASRILRGLGTEFSNLSAAAQRAARNQISAGSALVSLGAGMVFAGAAAGKWLYDSTKQAIEFERSIALVATQTDKVKVSQKELGDIVKDVAGKIAVPIEQLSQGLYDIFSSLNVTVPQSRHLLEEFAKEAVAGQVDLQTASRATIGILNAFHIPAENVNKVLDVQFQLVRKGVGTFEQFAGAIGKATPSAARAGQSIESLAGMLAYLTRNGLSADMAAASAARALDALANPKTVQRLEKMGVVTKDAKGEFRDIGGIMLDLQGKLAGLTAPERAAALQDLFKSSGGTIQARRFYDAVLKDRESVMQFLGLVGDMQNAQGAFTDAYSTMADTTAAKSQLLKNRWQIMRIEVGQALIPVFNKLLDILGRVLDWWNKLDDSTKFLIIKVIAISAALSTLLGIVTSVAGAFVMLSGAASLMGLSLGALLGIFALVVAGIGLLVAAGYLIYKNWDKIIKALGDAWNWLLNSVLKPVWDWIVHNFGERLVALWNRIRDDVVSAVKTVGDWVKRIWDNIVTWTRGLWADVMKIIQPLVDGIVDAWQHVKGVILAILQIVMSVFEGTWTAIVGVLKGAWIAISGVIEGIIKVLQGLIDLVVGVFSGDWKRAWQGIREIFAGVWKAIWSILEGVWEAIVGLIKGAAHILWDIIKKGWNIIVEAAQAVWDAVLGALETVWKAVVKLFVELPAEIFKALWKAVSGIVSWAYDVGAAIIEYFATGNRSKLDKLAGVGQDMAKKYAEGLGLGSPEVDKAVRVIIDNIHSLFSNQAAEDARNAGEAISRTLADGLLSGQQAALDRAYAIVNLIHGIFRSKDEEYAAAGEGITRALSNGLNGQIQTVIDVANRIVRAIQSIFNSNDSKYEEAGRKVVNSFSSGMDSVVGKVLDVANRIIGSVHSLFGGVSLRSEGAAIVESLKSGAESKISALTKVFQAITAMIPTVKGPMDKDKKLLTPNGIAIMNGLIKGIESQRDALRYTLYGVTGDITDSLSGTGFDGRPTSRNPLPYTYMPAGDGGGSVNQSITINTPQIVPERDAAILGFALSGRVG